MTQNQSLEPNISVSVGDLVRMSKYPTYYHHTWDWQGLGEIQEVIEIEHDYEIRRNIFTTIVHTQDYWWPLDCVELEFAT